MAPRSLASLASIVSLLILGACSDALDLSAADVVAPDLRAPDANTGADVFLVIDTITSTGTSTGTSLDTSPEVQAVDPCVEVQPARIEIRTLPLEVVTQSVLLSACGNAPYELVGVEILDDHAGVFSLEPFAPPLAVELGAPVALPVTFRAPAEAGTHAAALRIETTGVPAFVVVQVWGIVTSLEDCPLAVITCAEGNVAAPQTTLRCSASGSRAAPGRAIDAYTWQLLQPAGSVAFLSSTATRDVELTPNLIGRYALSLMVTDDEQRTSCAPATYMIDVVTDADIRVELLWRTPGDNDEMDTGMVANFSAGSDLDLHFKRGLGPAWFDPLYDAFWENPFPSWASAADHDNPQLLRDDTDGGGPENLNLNSPEDGVTYAVGVHYWDDWGYGSAFATVRVHIDGELRWSREVELAKGDLWEACTIVWPDGEVSAPPDPLITPDYPYEAL